MGNNKDFFNALLYSDIFNYPLKTAELWQYATGKGHTEKDFADFIKQLPSYVSYLDGYYFLKGREKIVKKRKKRERNSEKKLLLAKKVAMKLGVIPTILLIGVSGSVAVNNAEKDADIDFFIICKKNTLWQTRLYVTLFLLFSGLGRKRNERKARNKICTNMFVDEKNMRFAKSRQDLFTAHEIAQMKPVFERSNTYVRLIRSNVWVKKYLPNTVCHSIPQSRARSALGMLMYLIPIGSLFESLAKSVQLWYMRKHKTTEVVTDKMLAFHPIDYRLKTLQELSRRKYLYEEV